MRCPICDREFDPAAAGAAKPFCSDRCRMIDLGRWLGESYVAPGAPDVDPDEAAAGDSDGA